jgi:hypothetical protein
VGGGGLPVSHFFSGQLAGADSNCRRFRYD